MSDFKDYSLIRLFQKDSVLITEHILKLPSDDRYLRFGYNCSDDRVAVYVNNALIPSLSQQIFGTVYLMVNCSLQLYISPPMVM